MGGSGASALRLGASRVTQWIRRGRVPPKGLRGIQLPKGVSGVGIIEQWARFGSSNNWALIGWMPTSNESEASHTYTFLEFSLDLDYFIASRSSGKGQAPSAHA